MDGVIGREKKGFSTASQRPRGEWGGTKSGWLIGREVRRESDEIARDIREIERERGRWCGWMG